MKYYYTDPRHALDALCDHGIQIQDYTERELRECVGIDSSGGLYYIRAAYLCLLEPQVGDLVEIEDADDSPYCIVNYDGRLFSERHGIKRIIQRNGLPFMWPETEGAR